MNKVIIAVSLLIAFFSPQQALAETEPLTLPASMEEAPVWRLSLQDALELAIQNNLGIALHREQVKIGAANLRARHGSYEPSVVARFDLDDRISPPVSSTDGGAFTSKNHSWSLILQQRLSIGTNFALNFFNSRQKSTSGSAPDPLYYGSNLSLSIDQPLLRGFSLDGDVPRSQILQAKFANKKLLEEQRGVIATEVRRTEDAYWNLVQATRSYGVQQTSLQNAEQQLALTRQQITAGILAPADLIGSETAVAQRELQLVGAENSLASAMDALRHALNLPKGKWVETLLAIDLPTLNPRNITLEDALQQALDKRPELRVQAIDSKVTALNQRVADNARLPDLNVGFRYGLAGQSNVYSDSLDQLQGLGRRNWGVFVNLNWTPLGREASANQDSVLSAAKMSELSNQQFLNALQSQLRGAIRALETSRQRVAASEKFRELAERSLEAERKRFLNGKSRNLDVSLREDSLASARTAVISAQIQWVKASSDLDLATGQLLERKKIKLQVR